jgi:hypothetical protein
MELYKIMEEYGFKKSTSCSGFEWYTKRIEYNSVDALITITSNDEPRLPESLDEPVLVDITDRNSGNDLEPSRRFESLKSYLDTLDPVS